MRYNESITTTTTTTTIITTSIIQPQQPHQQPHKSQQQSNNMIHKRRQRRSLSSYDRCHITTMRIFVVAMMMMMIIISCHPIEAASMEQSKSQQPKQQKQPSSSQQQQQQQNLRHRRIAESTTSSTTSTKSTTLPWKKIHVMIYETEPDNVGVATSSSSSDNSMMISPAKRLVEQVQNLKHHHVTASIFGADTTFEGYGSKYHAALPILQQMIEDEDDNTLVVITDSRDVLLNHPKLRHHDALEQTLYEQGYNKNQGIVKEFMNAYQNLISSYPEAIVISAEAQCCVSALTHVNLGEYYQSNGQQRNVFACHSGTKECLWKGDIYAEPWEQFMMTLMQQRTSNNKAKDVVLYDDAYLNAGLMVGTPSNLVNVFTKLQIQPTEDDQAVLTGYMYHHPEHIVLDYGQTLFGNNRGNGIATTKADGDGSDVDPTQCVFHKDQPNGHGGRLVHTMTNTIPLFLHSPGGYYQCHDAMMKQLHLLPIREEEIRTQLRQRKQRNLAEYYCNYGRATPGDGIHGNKVPDNCIQPGPNGTTTNVTVPREDFWNWLSDRANETNTSIIPGPTPIIIITAPTPTTTTDNVVPVAVPTTPVATAPTEDFLSLLAQRTPSAPVPTPTTTTTEDNFLNLLAQRTKPTSPPIVEDVAPVPTPTTVDFLTLLAEHQPSSSESAPVSAPIPTANFLTLLAERQPSSSTTTTESTPVSAPVSISSPTAPTTEDNFISLLAQRTAPTSPPVGDFLTLLGQRTAPTSAPVASTPTTDNNNATNFFDLLYNAQQQNNNDTTSTTNNNTNTTTNNMLKVGTKQQGSSDSSSSSSSNTASSSSSEFVSIVMNRTDNDTVSTTVDAATLPSAILDLINSQTSMMTKSGEKQQQQQQQGTFQDVTIIMDEASMEQLQNNYPPS